MRLDWQINTPGFAVREHSHPCLHLNGALQLLLTQDFTVPLTPHTPIFSITS